MMHSLCIWWTLSRGLINPSGDMDRTVRDDAAMDRARARAAGEGSGRVGRGETGRARREEGGERRVRERGREAAQGGSWEGGG